MNTLGSRVLSVFFLACVGISSPAFAAPLAADDAAQSAYDDGWQTGDNGGTGFAPWVISTGGLNSLVFVGSSTTNGPINPNPQPGDIDVNGRSWGMIDWLGITTATRSFAKGPLEPGQRLSFMLDTGPIIGQKTGVALQNALGETRFEFFIDLRHRTILQQYVFTDQDSSAPDKVRDTDLTEWNHGVDVDFQLIDTEHFRLGLAYHGVLSPPLMYTGTLLPGDGGIDRLEFYYDGTKMPDPMPIDGVIRTSFLNSIQIIPEPAGLLFVAIGLAAALRRPRK